MFPLRFARFRTQAFGQGQCRVSDLDSLKRSRYLLTAKNHHQKSDSAERKREEVIGESSPSRIRRRSVCSQTVFYKWWRILVCYLRAGGGWGNFLSFSFHLWDKDNDGTHDFYVPAGRYFNPKHLFRIKQLLSIRTGTEIPICLVPKLCPETSLRG